MNWTSITRQHVLLGLGSTSIGQVSILHWGMHQSFPNTVVLAARCLANQWHQNLPAHMEVRESWNYGSRLPARTRHSMLSPLVGSPLFHSREAAFIDIGVVFKQAAQTLLRRGLYMTVCFRSCHYSYSIIYSNM